MAHIVKFLPPLYLVFCVISVLDIVPIHNFFLEFLSALTPYYVIIHLICLPFFIIYIKRFSLIERLIVFILIPVRLFFAALPALLFLTEPLPWMPGYIPVFNIPISEDQREFKVVFGNLFRDNDSKALVNETLSKINPDILAVAEVSDSWVESLILKSDYPYRYENPRSDCFGIALYSKFPFVSKIRESVGDLLPPIIMVDIEVPGQGTMTTVVVHALPPVRRFAYFRNRVLFKRLATTLRHEKKPVLFLGDMNATPFSSLYKNLLGVGKFRNAMHSRGLYKTWHASFPWLWFTIDHILYKGAVSQDGFGVFDLPGSDHRGVWATFNLSNLPQALPVSTDAPSHQ